MFGEDIYYSCGLYLDKEPNEDVKRFFDTGAPDYGTAALWFLEKDGDRWCVKRKSTDSRDAPEEGLEFVIEGVLKPNGLTLNGEMMWEGERWSGEMGKVIVKDNVVTVYYGHIVYKDSHGVPESEV